MNLECIYYIDNGTEKDYDSLATTINNMGKELFPVTLSVITTSHDKLTFTNHDREKTVHLHDGNLIMFVYGKAYLMRKICNAQALFYNDKHTDEWFRDIKSYDEQMGDVV